MTQSLHPYDILSQPSSDGFQAQVQSLLLIVLNYLAEWKQTLFKEVVIPPSYFVKKQMQWQA